MLHNSSASMVTYNSISSPVLLWLNDTIAQPVLYFLQSCLYVCVYVAKQLIVGFLYLWAILWMLSVYLTVKLSVAAVSKLASLQDKNKEESFKLPFNSQLFNQVVKIFQCLQWNINPAYFSKLISNPQGMQNVMTFFKNLFKMVTKVQF